MFANPSSRRFALSRVYGLAIFAVLIAGVHPKASGAFMALDQNVTLETPVSQSENAFVSSDGVEFSFRNLGNSYGIDIGDLSTSVTAPGEEFSFSFGFGSITQTADFTASLQGFFAYRPGKV